MVRRRWPDVLVILGVVAVAGTGVWALWWNDLRDWWSPPAPEVEEATHGGAVT
jgi:hypothetical protein